MIFNAYAEQKEVCSGITLVSCGHIFAKSGREINRPHGRGDWLIFYVAKGTETFYLKSQSVAEAGSFILFAPNEPQHHKTEYEKTAEFYYAHFRCDSLPDDLSFDTSHIYHTEPSRKITDIFEDIINETLKKQPCYEQLCVYKLLELLTLLRRDVVRESHPQRENFERIALAVSHMNKHYSENLSLSDYAALCNMSKHHFLRVFLQITGSTPIEYRNNIRLEHAAEKLLDGHYTVEQLGLNLGFSSASYFSSAFKKKYGLSPKQFSQKYK